MKKFFLLLLLVSIFHAVNADEKKIKIDWIDGPKKVSMASGISTLNLPKGYLYAGEKDTKKLMEYFGNVVTDQEIGMVFPNNEEKKWFVLFEYDPMGYVKDDEGKKIDADKLLQEIKENTEKANKEQKRTKDEEIKIIGWEVKPHYDETTHNLVWSILAESEGHKLTNYKTKILGRYGVTSITLVTDSEDLEKIKPQLEMIITGYSYNKGKTYAEFIPGKDKVAELGLTALIAGGLGAAAVKTGILAKLLMSLKGILIFLIFGLKKLWFIAIAGIVALFNKLFGKKQDKADDSEDNSETDAKRD
jgi:uncharacterized membrane-anchored protein